MLFRCCGTVPVKYEAQALPDRSSTSSRREAVDVVDPENDNLRSKGLRGALSSKLQVDFSELEFFEQIGKGSFKTVFRGRWGSTKVAIVRMRKGGVVTDARVMQRLSTHPNLVQFYRWAVDDDNNEHIIMELVHWGSLDKLLARMGPQLRTRVKVEICEQICSAMCALVKENVLHRDLAARNVLVQTLEPVTIKVSDFGLARDINRTYSASGNLSTILQCLPIRWVPPEVITRNEWSEKSDIWAYGITMWEIFSNGSEPYASSTDEEVVISIRKGLRLPRPERCPRQLYALMCQCWNDDPRQRPTFAQIAEMFRNWRKSHRQRLAAAEGTQQEGSSSPEAEAHVTLMTTDSDLGDFVVYRMPSHNSLMATGAASGNAGQLDNLLTWRQSMGSTPPLDSRSSHSHSNLDDMEDAFDTSNSIQPPPSAHHTPTDTYTVPPAAPQMRGLPTAGPRQPRQRHSMYLPDLSQTSLGGAFSAYGLPQPAGRRRRNSHPYPPTYLDFQHPALQHPSLMQYITSEMHQEGFQKWLAATAAATPGSQTAPVTRQDRVRRLSLLNLVEDPSFAPLPPHAPRASPLHSNPSPPPIPPPHLSPSPHLQPPPRLASPMPSPPSMAPLQPSHSLPSPALPHALRTPDSQPSGSLFNSPLAVTSSLPASLNRSSPMRLPPRTSLESSLRRSAEALSRRSSEPPGTPATTPATAAPSSATSSPALSFVEAQKGLAPVRTRHSKEHSRDGSIDAGPSKGGRDSKEGGEAGRKARRRSFFGSVAAALQLGHKEPNSPSPPIAEKSGETDSGDGERAGSGGGLQMALSKTLHQRLQQGAPAIPCQPPTAPPAPQQDTEAVLDSPGRESVQSLNDPPMVTELEYDHMFPTDSPTKTRGLPPQQPYYPSPPMATWPAPFSSKTVYVSIHDVVRRPTDGGQSLSDPMNIVESSPEQPPRTSGSPPMPQHFEPQADAHAGLQQRPGGAPGRNRRLSHGPFQNHGHMDKDRFKAMAQSLGDSLPPGMQLAENGWANGWQFVHEEEEHHTHHHHHHHHNQQQHWPEEAAAPHAQMQLQGAPAAPRAAPRNGGYVAISTLTNAVPGLAAVKSVPQPLHSPQPAGPGGVGSGQARRHSLVIPPPGHEGTWT